MTTVIRHMRGHADAILLCVSGAILLLADKPFGEACRRRQITSSGRDYGLLSFRAPILIIGALMLLLYLAPATLYLWAKV